MGHTNYYYQSRSFTVKEWKQITAEAKRIILAASDTVTLCGSLGTDKPEVDSKVIALNGDATQGEDHESFVLERVLKLPAHQKERGDKEKFDFCKTAHKPYDSVVVSILFAARQIAPDAIRVSSDGGLALGHLWAAHPLASEPMTLSPVGCYCPEQRGISSVPLMHKLREIKPCDPFHSH